MPTTWSPSTRRSSRPRPGTSPPTPSRPSGSAWTPTGAVPASAPPWPPPATGGPARPGSPAAGPPPGPFPADRSAGRVAAQLGPRLRPLLVGAFQVDELAVRPCARGTGLGRRLLAAVCDGAARDGRVWLLTARSAPDAVAFYRRLGWHEVLPEPGADPGDVVVFLAPGHPGAASVAP
ncbi:hypothetical protein GCM10018987_09100 [Streptomyces cremeus]